MPPPRLLAVCALDLMAGVLLRPWLRALRDAGLEVHIACRPGPYVAGLEADGFRVHAVALRRSWQPWQHLGPWFALYRLIRRGRYDAVCCHGPVAAAVGRLEIGRAHV